MSIQQISVFLENRAGQLAEITKVLADTGIDLRAISIAETADYGLLRLIVNDTDAAVQVLQQAGCIVTTTRVLAVAVPDTPGGLNTLLEILTEQHINVHYMYSIFGHVDSLAYMILQLDDIDTAAAVLAEKGIQIAQPKALGIH